LFLSFSILFCLLFPCTVLFSPLFLTAHIDVVSKLGMSGVKPPSHHTSSQRDAQLYTGTFFTALGPTQPPSQWVPRGSFPGVKRPEREADHSHPSSVEVNNTWGYTSTLTIRLHGVVLS
jgi:hypothetical protein